MSNLYAAILAGGSGTRLWPRSRRRRPKQLLDLISRRTMLQETYERIVPLVPPQNIYILTNQEYVEEVREQLPLVPPTQVIGEPEGRGTAPAAGLAALLVRRRDPDGVMFVLPADHAIAHVNAFRAVLRAAAQVAGHKFLVTLGVKPRYPETGYGYIEAGDPLLEAEGQIARRVRRFTEKPDLERARQFVAQGNYFWNSGIFIWRSDAILEELARTMPDLYAQLQQIVAKGLDGSEWERAWRALGNETIDYGVMEKARQVAVIPLDVGWSDVGSWAALFDLLARDDKDNVVDGEHLGIDTQASLIYSQGRLIVTIGLENMIVVDTNDVLLICPKDRAQEVKRIVEELKRRGAHEYL